MSVSQVASSLHQKLSPASLNIWHCQDCGRFHLTVEDICLTFAPAEFEELSQAIAGCHWQYEVSKLANAVMPALAV